MILSLSGFFLALAAYQILPHGVNAISSLGVWGPVIGFVGLGAGVIVTLVGCVKGCQKKESTATTNPNPLPVNEEEILIDDSFLNHIRANELFAVVDSSKSEITIYSKMWNSKTNCAQILSEVITYNMPGPQHAIQLWHDQNKLREFAEGKVFIQLETLSERALKESEQRKRPLPYNFYTKPVPVEALNNLFGEIDHLPGFNKTFDRPPKPEEMSYPIMKGVFAEQKSGLFQASFIAIKVKLACKKEEAKRKLGMADGYRIPSTYVIILYPHNPNNHPLGWEQLSPGQLSDPIFFTWNFTCPLSGEGTDSQKQNVIDFKKFIALGGGVDTRGVPYKIAYD